MRSSYALCAAGMMVAALVASTAPISAADYIPAGVPGADHSANAGSLSGLTLLATIDTPAVARSGGMVQAQCTAGVVVAFDDEPGTLTPTLIVLAGASVAGGQGGSLDLAGMPHGGRIRIYSSDATCRMAARAW